MDQYLALTHWSTSDCPLNIQHNNTVKVNLNSIPYRLQTVTFLSEREHSVGNNINWSVILFTGMWLEVNKSHFRSISNSNFFEIIKNKYLSCVWGVQKVFWRRLWRLQDNLLRVNPVWLENRWGKDELSEREYSFRRRITGRADDLLAAWVLF